MIKMLRDAHDDAGNVLYKEGEIVCATVEEEDILVRRNYAEWHDMPADVAAAVVEEADVEPVDLENAAAEGEDA